MMKKHVLLIFLFPFACFGQNSNITLEKLKEIAIVEHKVMMPMRDGIRLATDIYRPKAPGKYPTILSKTPYNFNQWIDGKEMVRQYASAYEAVQKGYVYVVQNERGRFFSEGEWDILGTPTTDGYDAFSWISSQDWSNNKIGTIGCSSTAEWQMAVASLDHPAHTALIPQGFGAGVGKIGTLFEQGNWFRGGAQQMLFTSWLYSVQNDRVRPMFPKDITQEELIRVSRNFDLAPESPKVDWSEALKHLPVQDIIKNVNGPVGVYEDMIRRKPNDPKWYKGGLFHDNMTFKKPSFWFVSWYDVATTPNIALFNLLRNKSNFPEAAENQYLVIAPTLHCAFKRATENTVVGERNIGDARLDYDAMTYGWFDYWLKGEDNGIKSKMPRVQYYTMGANKWQQSETWPPKEAVLTPYYLNSSGKANTRNGNGSLTLTPPKTDLPDVFLYDPENPVTSYGGNVCCIGNAIQGGAFDQQAMELREDILVYSTPPLTEDIEITGFIESILYVSSDAKDTDFTLKLIDVYPDGKAYNLDETIQRVRYREGYEKEVFMEKDKVYEVKLSALSTSNLFLKGHQIRIEISSSNFPRFDRNLNTGGNNYDESKGVIAKNKVHHSSTYPSKILLPIIKK
jgi:putative CocE/NonD family hydrolase